MVLKLLLSLYGNQVTNKIMETLQLKENSTIRLKGFELSIGKRIDQIALISLSSGEFVSFKSIKKGGRLSKAKRIFKNKLSSDTHFFFEFMTSDDTNKLISLFK